MDDLNIIDRLTQTFITYIDSGFGLLEGDVASLTTIIIGIDITLAGLFWALSDDRDVIAGLLKKVLYVGFFAMILNNFSFLADVIFNSFGALGLKATATGLSREQFLNPGFVAGSGFTAAYPILKEIQESFTIGNFFTSPLIMNAILLLLAWLLVVFSFFILSIQLFITIIEFKLTTLAGYVLVPFALWKRSAFLAERVLGNVISSGVKLMVLAVIVSIGSTFFADLTSAFDSSKDIELENAFVLVLAALSLVGLAIFVPGIAAGLVSGAPQLGAGAAIGTAVGVAAGAVAGVAGGAAVLRAGAAGVSTAVQAASRTAGSVSGAYSLSKGMSGATGPKSVAAGLGGVVRAGVGSVGNKLQSAGQKTTSGLKGSFTEGREKARNSTGGSAAQSSAPSNSDESSNYNAEPGWARQLRRNQRLHGASRLATRSIKEGDRPGSSLNPELKEDD